MADIIFFVRDGLVIEEENGFFFFYMVRLCLTINTIRLMDIMKFEKRRNRNMPTYNRCSFDNGCCAAIIIEVATHCKTQDILFYC